MFTVRNKHRYFRIQVCVSVAVSMVVYLLAKAGVTAGSNHSSPVLELGLAMFTVGPILAACVLAYFQNGTLRLRSVIGFSILLFGLVLVWPFVIASSDNGASDSGSEMMYFAVLNFVGFLIFGGATAWLGKLFGILTILAFSLSAYSGTSELLVLTPVLALLNVTSPIAQWAVAIVIAASSFLADR